MTDPRVGILRGTRELAAAADNRARQSVREWVENGCPHSLDGNVKIFMESEVIAWCEERGIDYHDKDKRELTATQQEKFRQERYKANELQHKEQLRKKEYSSVAEFEETTDNLLVQLRSLMVEVVAEIKISAGLSGNKAAAVDKQLADGFNRIAGMDVTKVAKRTAKKKKATAKKRATKKKTGGVSPKK